MSNEVLATKDNEILTLKSQIENFSGKESEQILALKTQIDNLINRENDNVSKLRLEMQNMASENNNKDGLIRSKDEAITRLENELGSLRSKQSHYDAATRQIIEMKNEVKKRDVIIEEREKQISDLKTLLEEEKRKKITVEPIKESKKLKNSSKLFDSVEINKTETILAQKDDF
jgi:predicted RNase H-like nuclease (RuvC/YqgF family)